MKRKLVGHTLYDKNGKLLKIESLDHHSMAVKTLFSKFCHGFGMDIVGNILSHTHDMAKGTEVFEKRVGLRDNGGEEIHFAHNVRGGIFLFEKYGDNPFGHMLAVCDVGHHGQLPNWSQLPSTETSKSMINADRTVLKMFLEYKERERVRKDYALFPEVYELIARRTEGCMAIDVSRFGRTASGKDIFASFWGMLTRVTHSRLIDADCLATEYWYHPEHRKLRSNKHADLPTLHTKLFKFIQKHCKNDTEINKWRSSILDCARKSATNLPGIFTMEADVGGGKTLAMLEFALLHAINNGMDRVIYVAPHGALIEQTADFFRSIFGENNVCVHHINMDTDKMSTESLMACDNWDAPIVVSSAQQICDTLYSNKNARIRKIHNIARSVVIFDEFHDLPLTKMWPVTHAINALAHKEIFGSSVLLASATLPVVDYLTRDLGDGVEHSLLQTRPKDIVPSRLFGSSKKRVKFKYDGDIGGSGDWESVANAVAQHKQCMVILNTRDSAYQLAHLMKAKSIKNVYHLSASIIPKDREKILADVMELLKNGEPVILVCTSIVQTGVDISFPCVYREMCGWMALKQASGRCNRSNEYGIGLCVLFKQTGSNIPGLPIIQANAMMALLKANKFDLEKVMRLKESFWKLYIKFYREDCVKNHTRPFDNNDIEKFEVRDNDLSFETIGARAKIIDEGQQVLMVMTPESKPIIDKFDKYGQMIMKAISEADDIKSIPFAPNKSDRRKAQQYSVHCYGTDTAMNGGADSFVAWLVRNRYARIVVGYDNMYILDKGYDEVYGISVLMDQYRASKRAR
jgi:CRISPR-associated endonuclease/helicase Cas3